jgi:hypothetical protein
MHDIHPYLPELFQDPGSLLYIGARPDACAWLNELYLAGNKIRVLEVWPENAIRLRGDIRIISIYCGDVRNFEFYIPTLPPDQLLPHDYTFWWHGPEHLFENEIIATLEILEKYTKKTIALACPWGIYPQGTHEGNPYEEHKTTLYPDFFIDLGYQVATDGEANRPGSEIMGWKQK